MNANVLIPVPETMRGFVVRVDPTDHGIGDDIEWPQPDWSHWLIEASMEDRQIQALTTVRRNIGGWMKVSMPAKYDRAAWALMADVHILSALWHPLTPFALGYRLKSVPDGVDLDPHEMTVIYRGDYFTRDRRGVLTAVPGQRDDSWPTPERWGLVRRMTLAWAAERGVL